MAEDYLPPVVTKLAGEIGDLLAKLTEAKAAMDAFNEETKKKSTSGGKAAGEAGANALLTEFEKQLAKATAATDRVGKLMAGEGDKVGKSFIDSLRTGITDGVAKLGNIPLIGGLFKAIGSLPPEAQAAIVAGVAGAIVAGAAFIGAALNGVILGALGGGVIALGIVNEIDHPVVKAALHNFTKQLDIGLTQATSPFSQSLVNNFSVAGTAIGKILTDLEPAFAGLARVSEHLTAGLMEGLKEFEPGFEEALKAAAPILDQFARDLPGLFKSFGEFWSMLAGGATGAKEGLHDLIVLFEGLTLMLGSVIEALSIVWEGIHKAASAAAGLFELLAGGGGKAGAVGAEVGKIATSFHNVAGGVGQATEALQAYSDALDKALGISLTADQANLKVKEDLTQLADAITQNGRNWDTNTKAGQANMQQLLQSLGDLEQARQANIAAGQSAITASQNYDDEANKLFALAQQGGMTKAQLDALKGTYLINIDTIYRTVKTTLTAEQFSQNPSGLALGGFVAPGGLIHAAQGMLPARSPGTLILAGEPQTGGEVLIPQRGISQQRAAALGTVAMAPYGLGVGVPAAPAQAEPLPPIVVQLVLPDGQVFYEKYIVPAALRNKRQFGSLGL